MSQKNRPQRQLSNASSLSRERSANRYVTKRHQQKRRRGVKGALVGVGVVAACAVVGLAIYLGTIQSRLSAGVDSGLLSSLTRTTVTKPFYMLLLGTDKSAEREETGSTDGVYRSDSIMLARIDPASKEVTLVSIERDILVDMGDHGEQKVNAAYTIGGAGYEVDMVSKLAGVDISHYAEINFDEFVKVVDTIGGIDVDIKIDLDDDLAGLHLKAGRQTINGEQALALCRARHAYDNYGGGDYYRTANQRMVIGAILKKILASSPATIAASVNQLAGSVTTDLSLTDILSLAGSFRGFDPSTNLMSGLTPTESKYINGGWYDVIKEDEWRTMMERVNAGLSPYASEDDDFTRDVAGSSSAIKNDDGTGSSSSSGASGTSGSTSATGGTVLVMNGAGVNGLAGSVATSLRSAGYTCEAVSADTFDHSTTEVLAVGNSNQGLALAVADRLGLSVTGVLTAAPSGTPEGFDPAVVVILGQDMAGKY